jgi:hypothetical protein
LVDKNHETLNAKIDKLTGRVDATNKELAALGRTVDGMGSKLDAFFWVMGGLIAIGVFGITVGRAVGWF